MGKGEQVLVCGDAPFLGGGDPDRALPLYTTPADYPLWFTKVGIDANLFTMLGFSIGELS